MGTMITPRQIEAAAWFLLGEGHFGFHGNALHTTANQVERWPLEKMREWFGGAIYLQKHAQVSRVTGLPTQPQWTWVLSGHHAAGLCMTVYPLVSPKRQSQIRKALAVWRSRPIATRFRTQCPKGHPYSAENTRDYSYQGQSHRVCAVCLGERQAARAERMAVMGSRGKFWRQRRVAAALLVAV